MKSIENNIRDYQLKLKRAIDEISSQDIENLSNSLYESWKNNNKIYICGNGGSAGNANHIVNDLIYGAGISNKKGLNAESLSANPSVLTCLANDIGYENIYSEQIKVKAKKNDLLIVLSGSGNSSNILNAIHEAKKRGVRIFSIVGFDGGECKKICENHIHFKINDMQISEDMQLIIFHICMKWLSKKKIDK